MPYDFWNTIFLLAALFFLLTTKDSIQEILQQRLFKFEKRRHRNNECICMYINFQLQVNRAECVLATEWTLNFDNAPH